MSYLKEYVKVYKIVLFQCSMEKSFFVVPILIILAALSIVFYVDIPTANDLALDTDATIIAGEYEACITPYTEISCKEGLECVLISEKPQRNGLCLKPGTELEEDFINRYEEEQLLAAREREKNNSSIDVGAISGLGN